VLYRFLILLPVTALLVIVPQSLTGAVQDDGPRLTLDSPCWHKAHPRLIEMVRGRISPDLQLAGKAAEQVEVMVWVKAGTDLSPWLTRMLHRPFVDPLGLQAVIGKVRIGNLERLLANDAVVQVLLPESLVDPPPPHNPGGDPPATRGVSKDWFEVTSIHRSQAAWDKGFTGQGVKVMVNDSGIDFCHPDLQGTWATVDDPSSPYYGWPMMFDSFSMYLLARDQILGESNIAAGFGDYSDTSATCDGADPCTYQPLTAPQANTYTLTGTSLSGVYHIGTHPDRSLDRDDQGRPAVLVVDEQTAGVYNTVYVDLDHNHDFTNDPAARRSSPSACGTYDGSSYSGGLVYFIGDGQRPVPVTDWLWGLTAPPANGSLVAFSVVDYDEPGGSDHGHLCASAVAAQGVINGDAPSFKPSYAEPGDGMVVGAARDAKLVSNGNNYMTPYSADAFIFAAIGYDGRINTADDTQIVTNSYGSAGTDFDGWDLTSRRIDSIQQQLAPHLSILFSTGNGAPGYGTLAPPMPAGAIMVGASTETGSAGQDGVSSVDAISFGDVAPFSNRGPSARGDVGVDVVAVGSMGAGDVPVNQSSDDVEDAWTMWSGTSRACPVAGANLALVYDAYRQANGVWPSAAEARALLMSGADDLHYEPFVMGAGMVNAERSTEIAAGTVNQGSGGLMTLPASWSVGDYHGVSYPAFANIVSAGQSYSQVFSLTNTGGSAAAATLSAKRLIKSGEDVVFEWTTTSGEDEYDFNHPDYLMEISELIPQGTDLMVVQAIAPLAELDHDGDYEYDSRWTVLVYDWIDDGDGQLWTDYNDNGVVNSGDIDVGDHYPRFAADNNASSTHALMVQRPTERMHDGIWLGLQHRESSDQIPATHFQVRIQLYSFEDWPWVDLPETLMVTPGVANQLTATIEVPYGTPAGLYQGALWIDHGTHHSTIPVSVTVAVELKEETLVLAGDDADDATARYNNGVVQGGFDWAWRADSGDWRFFFVDVPDGQPEAARFMVRTVWQDEPGLTDIDTLIFGPTTETDFGGANPDFYGPYTLSTIGSSPSRNQGGGVWLFDTSSNAHEDWVSAALNPGLHVIAVHNVLSAGSRFDVPFSVTIGRFLPSSSSLLIDAHSSTGSVTYEFEVEMPLDELQVEAYGLSCPETILGQVEQDASATFPVTIENGGRLEVTLDGQAQDDLDLYLLDPNGEQVASSTSSSADEQVRVERPVDGRWLVAVYGYYVQGGTTDFELVINAVQGADIEVVSAPTGPVAAGQTVAIELAYNVSDSECATLHGLLLLGPPEGMVFEVPITVEALVQDYTFVVPAQAHAPGAQETEWRSNLAVVNRGGEATELQLSYRPYTIEEATLTSRHTLAAGATVEWADLLVSRFGFDSEAIAKGSVHVGADQPLAITARTYNKTTAGTFGQYLPALTPQHALSTGMVGVIPQLKRNSAFRTNVGAVNLGNSTCQVVVKLYQADGTQARPPVTLTVLPGRYLQADNIFGSGQSFEIAYATVEVTTPGGLAWAYGSVVDNATGDPTTIPVLIEESGPYQVLGVAHAPGAAGTAWRSNLAVVNRNQGQAELTLQYYPYDEAGSVIEREQTVAAGATVEWQDLLVSLFELDDATAAKGTVHIEADQPLAIAARTYNQTADGTFGQYLPALTASQALTDGQTGVIPQLKYNASFRTNVGLLNLGSSDCEVDIRLIGSDGLQVGDQVRVTVSPGRYWQGDNIFGSAWTGAGGRNIAYAEIEVVTAGGQVWAYGSVVDNATGDPTTIPVLVE
jgi:hypothetical protein